MATIGLDKLYYAPITEDSDGEETYGTPVKLAKAMTVDLSVELAEATLYADDGAAVIPSLSDSELRSRTENIATSGCTESSSASRRPTSPRRATTSHSRLRRSKERSPGETRRTPVVSIHGRRRSLKAKQA